MDISKLTHGAKVVLGATIAFLIVSIFEAPAAPEAPATEAAAGEGDGPADEQPPSPPA